MSHSRQRKVTLPIAALGILLLGIAAGWGRCRQLAAAGVSDPGPQAFFTGAIVCLMLGLALFSWIARRRLKEQREAIRNLSEAMEQSQSAIMIMDLDNRIEYVNGGFCAQIGYSRRELIGRSWRKFQAEETAPEVLADLAASQRNAKSWTGEWFHRRKDGTRYPVRGVVSPVKRRDDTLTSYVAAFEDMTEMQRRNDELHEAKERAEAGGRAKSQFLTTMSHEVRTPLNGIVGFASLLLDMPLAPEQREYVQTIRTSAATLVNLTGDILDYARIESGKLVLDPGPCDLRACVEDALDSAGGLAFEKHLELLHGIEDDVPAVIVADSGRLRQALANLVSNAVKFTLEGEVDVRVRVVPPGPNPPAASTPRSEEVQLEFSVRDTGIGIASEFRPLLFKPFSQIDPSMTRRFGGTGLGLVISKTLVEMMGGRISFVSEPGAGSTFTFTVRALIYQEEQQIHATPALTKPLAGTRLALVTRAPGLRTELIRLLTSWGAEIVEIEYNVLVFTAFDLGLVDVDEMLSQHLRAIPATVKRLSPQKIFGLLPLSLPTAERQELRAHFRLLVNKPVHHTALLTLLLNSLPAHRVKTKLAGKEGSETRNPLESSETESRPAPSADEPKAS